MKTIQLMAGFMFLLMWIAPPPGWSQESRNTDPQESLELRETEITGSIQDFADSLKLFETKILGTVEGSLYTNPFPWKKPPPFLFDDMEFKRNFRKEIFSRIDRDLFKQKLRIRSR